MGDQGEVILLRRTGGLRLQPLDETLEINDDGSFSMWRSVSAASRLPSPVGRFAGRLSNEQRATVEAAADTAASEGSRTWRVVPDSPVDRVRVHTAEAVLGMRDKGDGAWAALLAGVRPLLHELTGSPSAALALEVGGGARLVHVGHDELQVDFAALAIEAVQWRGDDSVSRWNTVAASPDEVTVGPGWTKDLPYDHGFDLAPGDRIAVNVTCSLNDDERWVAVSLQTP